MIYKKKARLSIRTFFSPYLSYHENGVTNDDNNDKCDNGQDNLSCLSRELIQKFFSSFFPFFVHSSKTDIQVPREHFSFCY